MAGFKISKSLSPGFAKKIIEWTETESAHRRKIENKAVDAEIKYLESEISEVKRGQFLGFFIGIAALIAGTYAAVNGAQIAGGFIGAGGVVGLVTAFIYGRKSQIQNNEEKDRSTK